MLGLHHCLHHCDNLHIYLVIFSLFCLLLQSISPGLVCAAETCKEVQVAILEKPLLLLKNQTTDISPMWKSPGKFRANGKRRTSPNQVILFISWEQWREWKCSVESRWERISAKKKEKKNKAARWGEDAGHPRMAFIWRRREKLGWGSSASTPRSHSPGVSLTNGGQDMTDRVRQWPCIPVIWPSCSIGWGVAVQGW